jgi:hypothetical protein
MIRSLLIAIVMLVLAVPGLAANAAASAIGPYVYSYNGPESAYEIDRAGARVKLTPFLRLQPSDRVSVVVPTNKLRDDPNNEIVLRIDGEDVPLSAASPPYCVGAPKGNCAASVSSANADPWGPRVILANMLSSVGNFLLPAHLGMYTDGTESVTPRGGGEGAPLVAIPMLSAQRERFAAGDRALALAWENGTPPYEVRLSRAGAGAPIQTLKVSGPAARFGAIVFSPGAYRVDIGDSATPKGHVSATFDVVAPETLPALPPDQTAALADPSVPAELRATLGAALLAKAGDIWDLEAYQRVAPIVATYDPARLLAYQLVNGA